MIVTLARKELKSLFVSPLAWIVLAILQTIFAWIFLMRLDTFLELQPRLAQLANAPGAAELIIAPLYSAAAIVMLMTTPLISMRMIAEERRNRTMTLLVSAPVSMTEIVLGKFVGLTLFLMLPALMLTAMAMILLVGAPLDLGLVLANVLGFTLLVATFAAVGLFASGLSAHPNVAAVCALGILLGSWLASIANPDPASAVQMLSVTRRFEVFNAGIIDSGAVIWHVLVIALFLVFTIRRLDRDRLIGQAS